MDPVKQIVNPTAEVRQHASRFIDEYGEQWMMIDGVETKVPKIKQARALLAKQDAVRVEIRKELDERGIRDRTEQVEITLEDGSKTTVELLPPGDLGANCLQIGNFANERDLFERAAREQAKLDSTRAEETRAQERAVEDARLKARSPLVKIRDGVLRFLRKEDR